MLSQEKDRSQKVGLFRSICFLVIAPIVCLHHLHPCAICCTSIRGFPEVHDEHDESMLLAARGRRDTDPSKPEWSTTEARAKILAGATAEADILAKDKRALLPRSVQQSSEVPRERFVPSRLVLVESVDEVSHNQQCQDKVDCRRDQDP